MAKVVKSKKPTTTKSTKTPKKVSFKGKSTATTPTPQQLVIGRYQRAKNYRQENQEDIWERSYNNWRGVLDQTKYPWRSKVFVPWSFTVVETIIPKVFAREPKWRAIATKPDFLDSAPDTIQKLLDHQWRKAGMRLKMYDYIKDSLMYSKGYAKVSWNFKTKVNTYMKPVVGEDDEITFVKTTKSETAHDEPLIDIVDPLDIYVDPDCTQGINKDAAYVIHRKTVEYDTLLNNTNYKNVEQIKDTKAYKDNVNKVRSSTISPALDKFKNPVEILEYWGADDRLIVIANQSVVLRDDPNPYDHKKIPFVELDDYRDPHQYYGQSELSVIDPLQREINAIRNQRRDYDNLALNPVIQMVPGTLRNPNSAVMGPGNIWMVSDLNSIGTFELPQLQGSSDDIENITASDIQRSVAIDEIGIGLLPDNPQRRSATEVVTATTMAGKRFAMKIALLEEAVKEIGQQVFALDQQFLDQETVVQIVGETGANEWVKFTPDEIQGEFNIDIETGSMLPKDEIAARKEAVELLQYITPIISPVIQTNPDIILPVVKMVVDTFQLPGKDEILKDLKQALGVAAENLAEQRQAEQAATQANAIATVEKAKQGAAQAAQQAAESVQAPKTAQGERADLEAQQELNAR